MKIKRVLGPARVGRRLRIVRVEMVFPSRNCFVSVSLTPQIAGLWRSYREFRATLAGVQVHYRETLWRQRPPVSERLDREVMPNGSVREIAD
jgi:hypothetical protein